MATPEHAMGYLKDSPINFIQNAIQESGSYWIEVLEGEVTRIHELDPAHEHVLQRAARFLAWRDRLYENLGVVDQPGTERKPIRRTAEELSGAVANLARASANGFQIAGDNLEPILRSPLVKAATISALTVGGVAATSLPHANPVVTPAHKPATKEQTKPQPQQLIPGHQKIVNVQYVPKEPTRLRPIALMMRVPYRTLARQNQQFANGEEIPAGTPIVANNVASGVIHISQPIPAQQAAETFGLTPEAIEAANQVDEKGMVYGSLTLPGRLVVESPGQIDPERVGKIIGAPPREVERVNVNAPEGLMVIPTGVSLDETTAANFAQLVIDPSTTTVPETTEVTTTTVISQQTIPEAETPEPQPAEPTPVNVEQAPIEPQPPTTEQKLQLAGLWAQNLEKLLLAQISSGEGGYQSVNTGRAGDTKVGSTGYNQLFGGRMLTQLRVAEVLALQSKGRLFAVGRYQFIPATLRSAVKAIGLDTNTYFNQITQDKLARDYLLYMKRPKLAAFLSGKNATVQQANQDLCKEWASMPCNDGSGFYDGDHAGNNAHGGRARALKVMVLLQLLRDANVGFVQAWAEAKQAQERIPESTTTTTTIPVTTTTVPPTKPKVLVIGDSLSVGYKQTLVSDSDIEFVAVDAVVGRSLTTGENSGLQAIAQTDRLSSVDAVVLELGTNMTETEPAFKAGLEQAIAQIRSQQPNAKIFVPLLFSFKDGTSMARRRDTRNHIILNLAQTAGITAMDLDELVDTPEERVQNMSADQVHLDSRTYQATATKLVDQIKAITNKE